MTSKHPFDMTLDERWEQLEADALALEAEGTALNERDRALTEKYGSDPAKMPSEARSEWIEIFAAHAELKMKAQSLQMVSAILKKQSRLPGIGGFIGRLFGRGSRPGTYKPLAAYKTSEDKA